MTGTEFDKWIQKTGYTNVNDWGYQIIGGHAYYWIINPATDKFALIQYTREHTAKWCTSQYEVLVEGWTDFNGWAEKFHEETQGYYKNARI